MKLKCLWSQHKLEKVGKPIKISKDKFKQKYKCKVCGKKIEAVRKKQLSEKELWKNLPGAWKIALVLGILALAWVAYKIIRAFLELAFANI